MRIHAYFPYLSNITLWIVAAGLFTVLDLLNEQPRSPYVYLQYLLFFLMIAGLWLNSKFNLRKKIRLSRFTAPIAYVFLSWVFGMVYELTLTLNGTDIGGMHPDTISSFILAQGDYIALAVSGLLVIRYMRLSFKEMFFFAAGFSLTEGLIFVGYLLQALMSPLFFMSPILFAYYTVVYAFFLALPLLFIDEEQVWRKNISVKKRSLISMMLLGFIIGFGIRVFYGLLWGPFAESLFDLPPNGPGSFDNSPPV